MGAAEQASEAAEPTLERGWRFYAGLVALGLSVVMPLGALVVPLLGLSTGHAALLVGALVAGVPEVLCIVAVALLGKSTFQYLTHRAKSALRRAVVDQPASRGRYYAGLVIILLSWLPAYLYAYVARCPPTRRASTSSPERISLSSRASLSWAGNSGRRCAGYSFTRAGPSPAALAAAARSR